MSDDERVQAFNPILVLMWSFQLILFFMDLNSDGRVSWSIPIIGSFFIVQLYMVWRTNYEKMQEERRNNLVEALGGPKNVPDIDPTTSTLSNFYMTEKPSKQISGPLLNTPKEEIDEKEEN